MGRGAETGCGGDGEREALGCSADPGEIPRSFIRMKVLQHQDQQEKSDRGAGRKEGGGWCRGGGGRRVEGVGPPAKDSRKPSSHQEVGWTGAPDNS